MEMQMYLFVYTDVEIVSNHLVDKQFWKGLILDTEDKVEKLKKNFLLSQCLHSSRWRIRK